MWLHPKSVAYDGNHDGYDAAYVGSKVLTQLICFIIFSAKHRLEVEMLSL